MIRASLARLALRCLRRVRGRRAVVVEIHPRLMTERQVDDLVHGRPVRFTQPGVASIPHLGRVS